MIDRIVVPLDQSQISESALPMARGLAKTTNATVTLLSILEVPHSFATMVPKRDKSLDVSHQPSPADRVAAPSPFGSWGGWTNTQPSAKQIDRIAQQTSEAETYLKNVADTFEGVRVERVVQLGHAAERILRVAEHRNNSVIVMASHGRGGVGRALLGSVASRVVQGSTVPVFVTRGASQARAAQGEIDVQRILVPVDGSTFSENAVKKVREIFKLPIQIRLVMAVDDPIFDESSKAEEYLRWLSDQGASDEAPVEWELAEGSPSRAINLVADHHDVDLIAMTTHGRSGFDRFVIGSVAERVLHDATRPLLLIPPAAIS